MATSRPASSNPRRFLITGAILVVAGIFLFRDKMARDWVASVEGATQWLVDGDVEPTTGPADAVVLGVAVTALEALQRPLVLKTSEPIRTGGEFEASVAVTGSKGDVAHLTWRGDPPRLVDVTSASAKPNASDSSSDSGRNAVE